MAHERVAVVADDLTGALDTGVMFARVGLRTVVPLIAQDLKRAIGEKWDVICYPTDTRDETDQRAAKVVASAAESLVNFAPDHWFKKVDSRLKGPIGAEVAALVGVTGQARVLAIPAIPQMGRVTQDGFLSGRGVDTPTHVAETLGVGTGMPEYVVPDCQTETEIERWLQANYKPNTGALLLGARSLGAALASRLCMRQAGRATARHLSTPPFLIIGSRDPITQAQLAAIGDERLRREFLLSPNGEPPAGELDSQIAGIVLTQGLEKDDPQRVQEKFAYVAARLFACSARKSLFVCGGNTALAVMKSLGISRLQPIGEIEAGVPVACAKMTGRRIEIVTKSGGFGASDMLVNLLNFTQSCNLNHRRKFE